MVLYAVAWLAAGAAAGAALLVAVGGGDDETSQVLPPVRQTEWRVAADSAGCVVRTGGSRRREPPTDGPAGRPAAAGYYEAAPPAPSLVGAMRHGVVVISYRPDVAQEHRERLRALQRAVPRGTIVAPNDAMRFAIAVTVWRRLLGCRQIGRGTLDALRLFRGRFVGSGPDSPR